MIGARRETGVPHLLRGFLPASQIITSRTQLPCWSSACETAPAELDGGDANQRNRVRNSHGARHVHVQTTRRSVMLFRILLSIPTSEPQVKLDAHRSAETIEADSIETEEVVLGIRL